MYSVEPHPRSPGARKSTSAVLPFSRHGVMRASSVSPFWNRAPDPGVRRVTASAVGPLVGMFAMSRYGAGAVRRSGRDGFTSKTVDRLVVGQEVAAGFPM